MSDLVNAAILVISAGLLLYWFWPGPALCNECGSELDDFCFCTNEECIYHENQQAVRCD